MGSSGSSSKGSGGGADIWDWVVNPVGTAGNEWLGINLDPITGGIWSMTRSALDSDYRDEKGGFSFGDSTFGDMASSITGVGVNEATRARANDDDWNTYYESQGLDKWGKADGSINAYEPSAAAAEDSTTADEAKEITMRTKAQPTTSLLTEEEE